MFCLLYELDTFSITATSSRAARRSGIPTAGVSSSLSLVALYTSTCTVQYSTVQYSTVPVHVPYLPLTSLHPLGPGEALYSRVQSSQQHLAAQTVMTKHYKHVNNNNNNNDSLIKMEQDVCL